MKITLGLLGGKPMMAESKEGGLLESDVSGCPLHTQDEVINAGNKRKAEVTANYTDKPVAKCKDCEYFKSSKYLPSCGMGKAEGTCEIFEFSCNENNGCDKFEVYVQPEGEDYDD